MISMLCRIRHTLHPKVLAYRDHRLQYFLITCPSCFTNYLIQYQIDISIMNKVFLTLSNFFMPNCYRLRLIQ